MPTSGPELAASHIMGGAGHHDLRYHGDERHRRYQRAQPNGRGRYRGKVVIGVPPKFSPPTWAILKQQAIVALVLDLNLAHCSAD